MTVASTSAVIAQTSTATFDAWINEVYTNLVTNCGLVHMSASMDSGQMAVPSTTAVPVGANASAGYYMFLFNDTLATGAPALSALLALTAGTGYNGGSAGTFTGVVMSGGTGSGAKATVVLGASGIVSSVTITTPGTGYLVGDQLTVTSANMVTAGAAAGGGSSAFAFIGALTSGTPVVMKMEFGSGSAAADPMIWLTVSSGWASNGTLVGSAGTSASTRVAQFQGTAPVSIVTAYASRYCYNTTYGYLGLVFKINAQAANVALGSAIVFRSNDSNGNATGSSVMAISNSSTATGTSVVGSVGTMQCLQYANGVITSVTGNATTWMAMQTTVNTTTAFGLNSTLTNGNATIIPTYFLGPQLSFSAYAGVALTSELPIGASAAAAVIGSTPLTYLSVGLPFGAAAIAGSSNTVLSYLMLWV